MKTIVLFRVQNDEVFALFPELAASSTMMNLCVSYQHIGQHGTADMDCAISRSKPATKAQYQSLESELTSLGYELEIRKRTPRSAYETRKAQVYS